MQKPFLTVKSPVYVFKLTGGSISIINIRLEKLQLKITVSPCMRKQQWALSLVGRLTSALIPKYQNKKIVQQQQHVFHIICGQKWWAKTKINVMFEFLLWRYHSVSRLVVPSNHGGFLRHIRGILRVCVRGSSVHLALDCGSPRVYW